MRYVQLNSTWEIENDGTAIIHSEQMPPNPSIMAPGPALLYIVVDGVPSEATDVMVGDGTIGEQSMYVARHIHTQTQNFEPMLERKRRG